MIKSFNPALLLRSVMLSGFFLSAAIAFGQSTEEVAVKQALTTAIEALAKQPLSEIVQTYWIVDDKTAWYHSGNDGSLETFRKTQLLAQTNTPTGVVSTALANIKIVAQAQVASASFDETSVFQNGTTVIRHGICLLEKVNTDWKIHVLSLHTVADN